ncbi:MAG: hypothetical protein LH630_00675 [Actinomycetia bacterium]|nr:hypothetical protein [Actinomycetes bacterium]
MKARTVAAVGVGFALGALAAFALSLIRRSRPIDATGYQPPTPTGGPAAGVAF